ncbi:MAG: mitochondrial large ribosomal subunit protein uL15m, partial [Candidatus Cloacimonetes bacterium]|nr:mitochondrial large ribosomal subunit protein uL15m [Candidatus Cloacimonadota bacterium]
GAEEFNKKINIKANAFSKTARALIEKVGGKAEVI